jgi:hypothetical protein
VTPQQFDDSMFHTCGNEEVDVPAMTSWVQLRGVPVGKRNRIERESKSASEFGYESDDFNSVVSTLGEGENPHIAKTILHKKSSRSGASSSVRYFPVGVIA